MYAKILHFDYNLMARGGRVKGHWLHSTFSISEQKLCWNQTQAPISVAFKLTLFCGRCSNGLKKGLCNYISASKGISQCQKTKFPPNINAVKTRPLASLTIIFILEYEKSDSFWTWEFAGMSEII